MKNEARYEIRDANCGYDAWPPLVQLLVQGLGFFHVNRVGNLRWRGI